MFNQADTVVKKCKRDWWCCSVLGMVIIAVIIAICYCFPKYLKSNEKIAMIKSDDLRAELASNEKIALINATSNEKILASNEKIATIKSDDLRAELASNEKIAMIKSKSNEKIAALNDGAKCNCENLDNKLIDDDDGKHQ